MSPSLLHQKFMQGHTLEQHIETGNAAQQERWRSVVAKARITSAQATLVQSFTREMKLLVISGVWCGDCIEQLPLIQKIIDANPSKISMRILERDQHKDLAEMVKINAGDRVPVVLFLAEDFELCAIYGDRPLSRYRRIAEKKVGASCALGAIVPPEDEMAATTQDWLNEIERIQLMLRTSARLREKHQD